MLVTAQAWPAFLKNICLFTYLFCVCIHVYAQVCVSIDVVMMFLFVGLDFLLYFGMYGGCGRCVWEYMHTCSCVCTCVQQCAEARD